MDGYRIWQTDLYVMQNEHGLIKIGKSVDPERRRLALQTQEHCRIELVLVLFGEGHREEAVHRRLKKYHIDGEWFDGDDEARAAIARNMKRKQVINWPFPFDEEASEAWLEQFYEWRAQRLAEKEFRRLLSRVRSFDGPHWVADADVWALFWMSETGEGVGVDVTGAGDSVVLAGFRSGSDEPVPVPRYSADLDAAMDLWPADVRPPSWDGTALECCVAALKVRHSRLPRGWKRTRSSRPARAKFLFDPVPPERGASD